MINIQGHNEKEEFCMYGLKVYYCGRILSWHILVGTTFIVVVQTGFYHLLFFLKVPISSKMA